VAVTGHAGPTDLIYVNNEQEHVLERQAGFARLFLGPVRRSPADAIADHRIMANQPEGNSPRELLRTARCASGGINQDSSFWVVSQLIKGRHTPAAY